MNKNELVCLCMGVTQNEIAGLLELRSCINTADVQNVTYAGTGCGKCLPIIDQLVENSFREK